jgi:hypothetical protein
MSIGKRERRSTEFFEDNIASASSGSAATDLKARFDLSLGKGTPLSQFPGWVSPSSRGSKKEADALEDALEPLHRALFGRPGKSGERRQALAEYRGFPEAQRSVFKSKIMTWKKDQLKDLVQALGGSGILVSVPLATLGEDVLKFLETPHIAKAAAAKPTKATKPIKAEREPESGGAAAEAPAAKKARVEQVAVPAKASPPVSKSSAAAPSTKKPTAAPPKPSSRPTCDTVRVEAYRRVLSMSEVERSNLSVKGLRQAIGEFLKIDDATMKAYGEAVKETAVECVKALKAEAARVREEFGSGAPATLPAEATEETATEGVAEVVAAAEGTFINDDGASPKVALLDEE